MGVLTDKKILVGISGGIAAYKSATLVSALAQRGAIVTVAMTPSATRFITPLTLQALSARPVYTDIWQHTESHDPQHISLARQCDMAIVAPASMDFCAKLVAGMADDVVSLILSAVDRAKCQVLLAPSMNEVMLAQPATQRNLAQLQADGFSIVGPASGWQACRAVGSGRMTEPMELLEIIEARLGR